MNQGKLLALHEWARNQITGCIMPFWTSDFIVDHENGGFYGRVTLDMQRSNDEPRGLTLTGRMLYAFSTASRIFGDPLYRKKADDTYQDLIKRFYDPQYGGAYTTVTAQGQVLADNKPNYCEAFLIMGCAAYYRAAGCDEALRIAMEAAERMETKAKWAPACYYNNMTRDWKKADGMGFGSKSGGPAFPEGSILFPHHLCQAYVQLYKASGSPLIKQALVEMMEFLAGSLYDESNHCFKTMLAADGSRIGTRQSFGHDCEISYLAVKVAELVCGEALQARVKDVCVKVLTHVLEQDFDPMGSLYNGGDLLTGQREQSHIWWAQAEAVTAMLCGYELTGQERFLDACRTQAAYIDRYFVNREHGDWYNNIIVDDTGPHIVDGMHGLDKLNSGKCPFHNSQMCFEVMARTDRLLKQTKQEAAL